jgi:hypothetical protein
MAAMKRVGRMEENNKGAEVNGADTCKEPRM